MSLAYQGASLWQTGNDPATALHAHRRQKLGPLISAGQWLPLLPHLLNETPSIQRPTFHLRNDDWLALHCENNTRESSNFKWHPRPAPELCLVRVFIANDLVVAMEGLPSCGRAAKPPPQFPVTERQRVDEATHPKVVSKDRHLNHGLNHPVNHRVSDSPPPKPFEFRVKSIQFIRFPTGIKIWIVCQFLSRNIVPLLLNLALQTIDQPMMIKFLGKETEFQIE